MEILADTNIILRHLLNDSTKLSREATDILNEASRVIVLDLVIAEIIWVLTSFYKFNKESLIVLVDLLSDPKFEIHDKERTLESIQICSQSSLSYVDAVLLLESERLGIPVKTFDKALKKKGNRV